MTLTEKEKHLVLKERAKGMLISMGFKEEEIHFEDTTFIDGHYIRPDVVGIKDGLKVAVECGGLNGRKRISKLLLHFDKVVHLPYLEKHCYPPSKYDIYEKKGEKIGETIITPGKKFMEIPTTDFEEIRTKMKISAGGQISGFTKYGDGNFEAAVIIVKKEASEDE